MMKPTSQSGKNVKFERFHLKNNFRAFEAKCSIYFLLCVVDQNLKGKSTLVHKTCCSVKRDCCVTLDCNTTSEFCNKELITLCKELLFMSVI